MNTTEKPVSEVMTRTVCEITTDLPVALALELMHRKSVSSVLVVEDEMILGIVTERDVVRALHRSGNLKRLSCVDLMQAPVISVEAATSCLDVYHLMAGRGIRHIAVTDAAGHLVGIASEGDILRDFGIEYFMRFKDVGSVMTTHICLQPKFASIAEVVALMDEQRHSCVIAVDNLGRPVGILTERDIVRLCHENDNPDRMLLGQTMRGPVKTASTDDLLHEAVEVMKTAGIRRLVVIDGDGRVCGLLTHHEVVKGLEGGYVSYLREMVQRQEAALQTGHTVLKEKLLLDNILRSATGTAVLASDRNFRVAYCNPTVMAVLDLVPAKAIDLDLRDILTGLGWPQCRDVLSEAALADGKPHAHELVWTEGSARHRVDIQVSLLLDEQDRPQGFLLMAQNAHGHDADNS